MVSLIKKSIFKAASALLVFAGLTTPLVGWANCHSSKDLKNVEVYTKTFNQYDCKKYLDRDVIAAGYQPIQIIIKNNSDKVVVFSPDQVSLTCARVEEVAARVRTSTTGRAVGYGAAAVFFMGLFAIPAIIDGVGSARANSALDADYYFKVAKGQSLSPNTKLNGLLFVPKGSFTNTFTVTLREEGSNKVYRIPVVL